MPQTKITNNELDQSAWTAYTPVWTATGTAPAIGNGTLTGAYKQIGKTVSFRFLFQAGTTTTFGSSLWRFSLPLLALPAMGASPISPATAPATAIGNWYGENPGQLGYGGSLIILNSSVIAPHYHGTAVGNMLGVGTTGPATWANTWYIMGSGTYEVA